MTNSPGGIQAGRDVVIQSGSKLIHSIVLRVYLEVETPEKQTGAVMTDVGLQSACALFTGDKTRIRFVTDYMIQDQQIAPKVRRMSLVYTPETPNDIQGKEIKFLESINLLAINYSDIFRLEQFALNREHVKFVFVVELNGLEVGNMTTTDTAGTLLAGQGNMEVSALFRLIPQIYEKKTNVN